MNELRTRLVDAGLARVADELVAAAAPCVTIRTEPGADAAIPVGDSKFGGEPDLPAGFSWPQWNGRPLSFLCQIRLSAVAENPAAAGLPTEGLLAFFYDPEQSTWGFDPKDRGSWAVHLFNQGDLQRTAPPESLPEDARYRACGLTFGSALTLPGWETATVESLELTDAEQDVFFDISDYEDAEGHHLLGHPQEVQGAMQLECQLVSHGIYCGGLEGYEDPRVADLQSGAADWILLLQVDTDENPGWMWGDCGRLYFWVTKADLAASEFDRVWMILQCS